jgi:CheY-like chemotaxis protein
VVRTTTALIADDGEIFLLVAKAFLARRGIEVITAENGKRALDLARAHHPRLILLDLNMPEMDGVEACAAMRRDPTLAYTPIFIMSSAEDAEHRERCLQAGCTKFIVKPTKPETLLTVVARIVSFGERKPVRMSVFVGEETPVETRWFVATAGNLSGTGMLLLSRGPIRVGALLHLDFVLPTTRQTIRAQGRASRVDQNSAGLYEVGVHFVDLSQAFRKKILACINS